MAQPISAEVSSLSSKSAKSVGLLWIFLSVERQVLKMDGFKTPKSLDVNNGSIADNWEKFRKSNHIYMKAAGNETKTDQVKAAIWLNLIGEDPVDIFNTLNLTQENQEKEVKVLEAFEKYCIPRKNVVYERYLFHNRNQKE